MLTELFVFTAQRDIMLEEFLIGAVLAVPGDVKVSYLYSIAVGSRASDLSAGQFLSTVYLSHDEEFDIEDDLGIVNVPNDAGRGSVL